MPLLLGKQGLHSVVIHIVIYTGTLGELYYITCIDTDSLDSKVYGQYYRINSNVIQPRKFELPLSLNDKDEVGFHFRPP